MHNFEYVTKGNIFWGYRKNIEKIRKYEIIFEPHFKDWSVLV